MYHYQKYRMMNVDFFTKSSISFDYVKKLLKIPLAAYKKHALL